MTRAWIFQANPKRFNIEAFLASGITDIEWLVSGYAKLIAPGDTVYLWRSAGDGKDPAGIYAAAKTLSTVRTVADDGPPFLWSNPAEAAIARPRARIRLTRIAAKKEFIKRDWWKEDPILRNHLIMRMAAQTTFPLEGEERARLEHIWARIGLDWTYSDSIAGLNAYVQTYGKEVSKLAGSPVATTALLIGRPITGAYNKVMNFRALDPRDLRAGFTGASGQDRAIWARFFDPAIGLKEVEVRAEFDRLFAAPVVKADVEELRRGSDTEADRLSGQHSLSELLALWSARAPRQPQKPKLKIGQAKIYDRDPLVVAIARERADWRCEVPGCAVPTFEGTNGVRYVEVHHIHPLMAGGEDTPENTACVCALHHREAHLGKRAPEIALALQSVRNA